MARLYGTIEIMHIKICGLTNLEDALAAIDAGADYLGFNFYPKSPRYLTPETCASIVQALWSTHYDIRAVGIFVNEPSERVAAIMEQCGLDLAQLHGEETPETLSVLRGRAFKAFRGIGQQHAEFAAVSPLSRRGAGGHSPAFLIDAYSPNHYGGTGHTADWEAARAIAAQYPIFLAGGLTPDNVAEAIAKVQPWGVDVASGVEIAPRKKDHAKVRQFIQEARKAGEQGGREQG